MNDEFKLNKLFYKKCIKPKCKNENVLMKPAVADGYFVGVCGWCQTKLVEKEKRK